MTSALSLPKATVARVLGRHGKSRLPPLQPPPKVVHYEYKRPGGLIHLDVKKLDTKRGAGWEFVHVCIDDHSGLACVEVLVDEKGPTTVAFLGRAIAGSAERGLKVRERQSLTIHPDAAARVGLPVGSEHLDNRR